MLVDQLASLAYEKSSERRREILRAVADLFVAQTTPHSQLERIYFEEIVTRVVGAVEEEDRARLSEKLALHPEMPRRLAMRLAEDTIGVAAPVLRQCRTLTDEDLAGVAERQSDQHLSAIADRPTIAAVVTDVLVRRGSSEVVHKVGANHGAQLSSWAMGELVSRAETDVVLRGHLGTRRDLSPEIVQRLAPLLAKELRDRRNGGSGPPSDDMVEEIERRLGAAARGRARELRAVKLILADIRQGRTGAAAAITELAAADRMIDVAELIGALVDVAPATVFGALMADKAETLLVLCRALDLDYAVVEVLLRAAARRRRQHHTPSTALARAYTGLAKEDAERALRFLKVRSLAAAGGPGAPAKVAAAG